MDIYIVHSIKKLNSSHGESEDKLEGKSMQEFKRTKKKVLPSGAALCLLPSYTPT